MRAVSSMVGRHAGTGQPPRPWMPSELVSVRFLLPMDTGSHVVFAVGMIGNHRAQIRTLASILGSTSQFSAALGAAPRPWCARRLPPAGRDMVATRGVARSTRRPHRRRRFQTPSMAQCGLTPAPIPPSLVPPSSARHRVTALGLHQGRRAAAMRAPRPTRPAARTALAEAYSSFNPTIAPTSRSRARAGMTE